MKKLIPILSLILVLALLPLPAIAAQSADPTEEIRTATGLSPLEEAIYCGLMATEERIDLSALGASGEEVTAAMQHLLDSVPELFHVSHSFSYSATAVVPSYTIEGDALAAARAEYLFAIDRIAEGVDPAWSDAMICLYLHDYLCKAFAYDTTYSVYDAYTFFTGGTGVCQSYTLAYTALLSRFGIPVTYATGKDGDVGHIWNIVELDGEYYHVDVTWGDALTGGADYFGRATHDNFLKSDAAIDATGHTERQNHGGIVCDSTRFDGGALDGVESPTAILDGTVYAIRDGEVLAFSEGIDAAPTVIYEITEEWRTGLQTLVDKPAGLAAYGDTLYINTPTKILSLDPASGHTEVFFTAQSGLIMTVYNEGETLYYRTADTIHGQNARVSTLTLPASLPPCTGVHSYEVYATLPATCTAEGTSYQKCTACGDKTAAPIPMLPHTTVTTVVPPGYGVGGYTAHTCTVCGHTEHTDPTDALPLPTMADYRAAVAAAEAAEGADARVGAFAAALAMEPYIDGIADSTEYRTLHGLMAAYEGAADAANESHAEAAALLFADPAFFTGAGTAMLLFYLVLRRIFGL